MSLKIRLPLPGQALPGRSESMTLTNRHYVNNHPLTGPFSSGFEEALFGMGCFWGAERIFWEIPGVYTTAVGYAGGSTQNPTYRETCSGMTGHTEVVFVVFYPVQTCYEVMLNVVWENHDPTQGMRQGNDMGTQYRSAIYCFSPEQRKAAEALQLVYEDKLTAAGHGAITTEIKDQQTFYYAEDDHQQYLAKNPGGYCGHGGTGVSCPVSIHV